VSACVIAKDEEENLPACLDALAFCDEVLLLDSGSRDRTVSVARARGARVVETGWPGMVAQKNRAVALAGNDWVLCVDADERVTPRLRASIERALAAPRAAGYAMAWETVFLGGVVRSDRGRARWKVRLFDRRRGRWVGDEPHGHVEVDGPVERLAGALEHRTVRDLAHAVAKMNAYTTAAAEVLEAKGKSVLFGLLARPPAAFFRSFALRGGFRDGWRGFVVAANAAAYVFVKHAKRYERLRRARGDLPS